MMVLGIAAMLCMDHPQNTHCSRFHASFIMELSSCLAILSRHMACCCQLNRWELLLRRCYRVLLVYPITSHLLTSSLHGRVLLLRRTKPPSWQRAFGGSTCTLHAKRAFTLLLKNSVWRAMAGAACCMLRIAGKRCVPSQYPHGPPMAVAAPTSFQSSLRRLPTACASSLVGT
jgi:hypothetical protein